MKMSRSHHFRGIAHYAEQLMDLAEGQPIFTGRGKKPSNKEVLAAIVSIDKCRQGSFFSTSADKSCSCGWHKKAAARKQARQAQSGASSSSTPTAVVSASSARVSSPGSSSPTVCVTPPALLHPPATLPLCL